MAGQRLVGLQAVGAALCARAAVDAILDLRHIGLPLRPDQVLPRGAGEQLCDAVGVVDGDAGGAGQAVAAAAAERAGQLAAVLLDAREDVAVHFRGILGQRQYLLQLAHALYAPDGHQVVELPKPGKRQPGVGDQPAGERLHADKAHVLRTAQLHQLDLAVGGQVVEGVLQRVEQPGIHGLKGTLQGVVGDADEADLSRLTRLHGSVVQAVFTARDGDEVRVVELIDVDHVGIERLQARLEIAVKGLGGLRGGLGGDDEFIAPMPDARADLGFAVGIGPRGVDVGDAAVQRAVQYAPGLLKADALDWQRAEAGAGDLKSRASECEMLHGKTSLPGYPVNPPTA